MITQIRNFFNGKTVLVTGHTGFKGSWLALWLKMLGANVIGFALPPEENQDNHYNYNLINLGKDINSIYGDITDYESFKKVFEVNKIDLVFHLAAQSLVRKSYSEPVRTYSSNVMGTVNLLDIVKNIDSVKAVVNITTDKCYENKEWNYAYRENDELGGFDPYSSSKACAEIITSAFRKSFYKDKNIALASARAGNVFGGGDFSSDRIIPDIIRSIAGGDTVTLRNPQSIRPWQHVFDVLFGYLLLAMKLYQDGTGKYQRAYNFSPKANELITVQKLTEVFLEKIAGGRYSYNIDTTKAGLHEAKILILDSTLALTTLQWQPVLPIDDALQMTADWYDGYLNSNDIKNISIKQLEYFMNLQRSI